MRVYVRGTGSAGPGSQAAGSGKPGSATSGPDQPRPGTDRVPGFPPTVPPFPQEVLDRHNARLLQPATAVLLAGQPTPLPTAYRAGVLLLPDSARRAGSLHNLNKLLADSGVYLDDSAGPKEFDEFSQT